MEVRGRRTDPNGLLDEVVLVLLKLRLEMMRLQTVRLFGLGNPRTLVLCLRLVGAKHTEEFIGIPVELDISSVRDDLVDGELQRIDTKDGGRSGNDEQSVESGTALEGGSVWMQTRAAGELHVPL